MNYLRYYFRVFSIVLFSTFSCHVLEGTSNTQDNERILTDDEISQMVGLSEKPYTKKELQALPFFKHATKSIKLQLNDFDKIVKLRLQKNLYTYNYVNQNRLLNEHGEYQLPKFLVMSTLRQIMTNKQIIDTYNEVQEHEKIKRKLKQQEQQMEVEQHAQHLKFELDRKNVENAMEINKLEEEIGERKRNEKKKDMELEQENQRSQFKLEQENQRSQFKLEQENQRSQFELEKEKALNKIELEQKKYDAEANKREEENQQKIKEITTRIDVFFSNLVSPKFGLVMVGIFGGIIFVWFFSKYGIPKLLNPPPALVKESTLGFWNRFKKRPKSRKNELVYPPHIEQRLMGLIAEMKALVALKMQGDPIAMKMLFSDFLLLGASGVGKTALAKVVAIEAGFDYVIIDGPRLSQLEEKEALKFLYSLLQRASTNKRPVLIFLDESNSILPRRGSASILDSKVTNAWLGAVESGNHPNILVVYSTNLLEEMDTAVIDRLEIIHIPMPDREEIFRIFFEKNIQRKSAKMGISLSPEIRKSKEEISDALHGFSGRGAKKISVNLLRKAYFNKGKKLTNAMVMEEIEQHQFKKREAAKRALERKA